MSSSPEQHSLCADCPQRILLSRLAAKIGLTKVNTDCQGPDEIAYYQYTGQEGRVLTSYSHGETICSKQPTAEVAKAAGAEVLRVLTLTSGKQLTIAGRTEDELPSIDMHLAENFGCHVLWPVEDSR